MSKLLAALFRSPNLRDWLMSSEPLAAPPTLHMLQTSTFCHTTTSWSGQHAASAVTGLLMAAFEVDGYIYGSGYSENVPGFVADSLSGTDTNISSYSRFVFNPKSWSEFFVTRWCSDGHLIVTSIFNDNMGVMQLIHVLCKGASPGALPTDVIKCVKIVRDCVSCSDLARPCDCSDQKRYRECIPPDFLSDNWTELNHRMIRKPQLTRGIRIRQMDNAGVATLSESRGYVKQHYGRPSTATIYQDLMRRFLGGLGVGKLASPYSLPNVVEVDQTQRFLGLIRDNTQTPASRSFSASSDRHQSDLHISSSTRFPSSCRQTPQPHRPTQDVSQPCIGDPAKQATQNLASLPCYDSTIRKEDLGFAKKSTEGASARKPTNRRATVGTRAEGSFVCEACGSTFGSQRNLSRHGMLHRTKGSFPCEFCDKVFRQSAHRALHTSMVHERKRPFGCELCGQNFVSKSNLVRHKKTLHAQP